MSHKSKPNPKTSVVMDTRKPITSHAGRASVGHGIGSRKKTITDPQNGRGITDVSGGTRAPGAGGPSETE
jgi:hypothetical protein